MWEQKHAAITLYHGVRNILNIKLNYKSTDIMYSGMLFVVLNLFQHSFTSVLQDEVWYDRCFSSRLWTVDTWKLLDVSPPQRVGLSGSPTKDATYTFFRNWSFGAILRRLVWCYNVCHVWNSHITYPSLFNKCGTIVFG